MSVLLYGQIVQRRRSLTQSQLEAMSPQEEKESKFVTSIAALVPAEILVAHAFILTKTTATDDHGTTTITDPATLQFWLPGLVGLTVIGYLFGRRFSPTWTKADVVRLFIPPLAFLVWTALIGTSALTPWVTGTGSPSVKLPSEAVWTVALVAGIVLIWVSTLVNPPKPTS